MRVLVACEESGAVRDQLLRIGVDAMSCDLKPSATPGPHYVGDVFDVLEARAWDALIAFPPCTHLAASGARWFPDKRRDGRQDDAVAFVLALWLSGVPRIAIENPVGILPQFIGPATQVVQPWQHGHGEQKATCLWLKNLPPLKPTNVVAGREQRVHRMSPGPQRAELRSKTYPGIARAMAEQWFGEPSSVQRELW